MGDRVGGDVTPGAPLLPVLALSVPPPSPPFFVRRNPRTMATMAQIRSITAPVKMVRRLRSTVPVVSDVLKV